MLKDRLQWLSTVEQLEAEWKQSADEGRWLDSWEEVYASELDGLEEACQERHAGEIYDRVMEMPPCPELLRREPSGYMEIQACLQESASLSEAAAPRSTAPGLKNRVHGAWLGRVAGCLLGKPFEGWFREDILTYLRDTGADLTRGFAWSPPTEDLQRKYERYQAYPGSSSWVDLVEHAPIDDDTNYTLVGLRVVETCGRHFSPMDVAEAWLNDLPVLWLCTAERVAYRNLLNLHEPGASATCRNPYREWIGAQIRADFYGYICPGNPGEAARMAWTDGSISHTRNGLYGAMFVAALLAQAHVERDVPTLIETGLSQIPPSSRLSREIQLLLGHVEQKKSWDDMVGWIHARWNERDMHHWAHTIPNALIVCASLLYGTGRFEDSAPRAVMSGFDTDCNAATVGSVTGLLTGAGKLDGVWMDPLRGKLASSVRGFGLVSIGELAVRTVRIIENEQSGG